MSYTLKIKASAKKELKKLPKYILAKIKTTFDSLSINPRLSGVKKLQDTSSELYRIRIGDYRVVYEIHDNILTIIVVALGHRSSIYRKVN